MFHPASLLLAWLAFAFALQWLSVIWLAAVAAACIALAIVLASDRTRALLRRTRWLLLSLLMLYLFFTPGEYLPGMAGTLGLTHEGLRRGAEQIGRLLTLLASLALLHRQLGTTGLLAGLHWLLTPFAWREKTVVRLMLVLDTVERQRAMPWREWLMPSDIGASGLPSTLTLTMPRFRAIDCALMLFVAGCLSLLMRYA
ncbi:CbiQ family ECF transporter T component [Sulfuricystis multivorans]|uniref:CbiQ family ECF transporter T component n=1 Tax=Sulfuricystis multivorans TaxID=2211108 RepID=UPI001559A0F7|nr:CbiQ family ECF transporter T component [Sulfuricystis multivorans]